MCHLARRQLFFFYILTGTNYLAPKSTGDSTAVWVLNEVWLDYLVYRKSGGSVRVGSQRAKHTERERQIETEMEYERETTGVCADII